MGAYNFTYELPGNFDRRVVQYLQQSGKSSISEAFQRCEYEYDDVGLLAPGEISHFGPGGNRQFWPDENRQS